MIGRLTGNVIERDPQSLLLDVAGVGYEVEIPLSTFYQLAETEGPVTIYTHFVVRQDAQLLYGFASSTERDLFRTLLKVNSVGPKTALAVLSGLSVEEFAQAVEADNKKLLAGIPGVSAKNAGHITVELAGKLDAYITGAIEQVAPVDVAADAESALIGLGYKPAQASKALAQIEAPADDVETLIKQALKELMKG